MRNRVSCSVAAAVLAGASLHPAQACTLANSASDVHLVPPATTPITVGFGMKEHPLLGERKLHTGLDYKGVIGMPILAAGPGRVASVGREGYYGNLIVIDHGGGVETAYAHLSRFNVTIGSCVEAGAHIGDVGVTGLSSGPHLHFEVRTDGKPVDPALWLGGEAVTAAPSQAAEPAR